MTTDSIITILFSGALAAAISVFYTFFQERRRRKQEMQGQSLSLITAMEGFIVACAEYVDEVDDATNTFFEANDYSPLDKTCSPAIEIPPHVDFSAIDPSAACEIITLPILARQADLKAIEVFKRETSLDAHAFSRDAYASLGLKAWGLSERLRIKAGLPKAAHLESGMFLAVLKRNLSDPCVH